MNCEKCKEWHPFNCLCVSCVNDCNCMDAKRYNNKEECLFYKEKEQIEIVFKNGSVIKGISSTTNSIRGSRSRVGLLPTQE